MNTSPILRKSSRVSVSLDLPLVYYDWIKERLKQRSLNEIWIELIDLYLVREADQLRRLRFQILKRVKQGIDAEYLDQLKLLHDVLGQILTRCGVTLYD